MKIHKGAAFVCALAMSIASLSACAAAPDQRHDEAIEQCQEALLDRARDPDSARFDEMSANGGSNDGDDPNKYLYGVEGQFRAKNGFGALALENVMCLAIYDSETDEWDVTAQTY